MKPNIYAILSNCIEEGIAFGMARAHKHTDTPDKATIEMEVHNSIMNSICKYFTFDHDSNE